MRVKELMTELSRYNPEAVVMIETGDGANRIRQINYEGPAGLDFDELTCKIVTLIFNEERDKVDEYLYSSNGLSGDVDIKLGRNIETGK